MKKIVCIPILTILIAFLLMSCEKVLDKENLTAVKPVGCMEQCFNCQGISGQYQ